MFNPDVFRVQLEAIFQYSRDFIFLMKRQQDDFQYIYLNLAAKQMLHQDATNKLLSEVTSQTIAKVVRENYEKALEQKEQIAFEDYSYIVNEVCKHETTVTPIFHEGDEYVFAITKEIAFDRDLQDKYLFMRSVFFNTFMSTVLISNDLQLLEANPSFTEDFDINIEELRGQHFLNLPFIHRGSKSKMQRYLKEAQRGLNFSKVLTFVDKSGKARHFTGTFSPLTRDDDVIAVFIILQDISAYVEQGKVLRSTSHVLDSVTKAIGTAADIVYTNLDGTIFDVNQRYLRTTGYSKEELVGKKHSMLSSGTHDAAFYKELWSTIERGEVWRGEIRNRAKTGEYYWIDCTIIPLFDEKGNITQYFSVNFNITEKLKVEEELKNSANIFNMITESTSDFIVILNKAGYIQYASPSYTRKLGYSYAQLKSYCYRDLLDEKSKKMWDDRFTRGNLANKETKLELVLTSTSGKKFWTEANYTISYDSVHEIYEIVIISREISERKKKETQLQFLAFHDALTQLPNRRFLHHEFPKIIDEAFNENNSVGILYIDGDNFKGVNDQYGHDVGDVFLNRFAQALRLSIREMDVVVRLGGDEFLVILKQLSLNIEIRAQQLQSIMERIQHTLYEGWIIDGYHFKPTTSIGVAFYPDHGEDLHSLLEISDAALYVSKQQKNCFYIAEVK